MRPTKPSQFFGSQKAEELEVISRKAGSPRPPEGCKLLVGRLQARQLWLPAVKEGALPLPLPAPLETEDKQLRRRPRGRSLGMRIRRTWQWRSKFRAQYPYRRRQHHRAAEYLPTRKIHNSKLFDARQNWPWCERRRCGSGSREGLTHIPQVVRGHQESNGSVPDDRHL